MSSKKSGFSKPNIIVRRDMRLVVCSDEHCGHLSGLTPPEYQGNFILEDIAKHNKLTAVQRQTYNFFADEITASRRDKEIDIFVNNGDFLDGTGWRSGGTELLTTDRNVQINMCKEIVKMVGAKSNHIVAGTAYHTGEEEDWEQTLATQLGCKFENHAWLDINNKVFDIKHHCGSSALPHGRFTAIAKDALLTKLWGEASLIPKPVHVVIRGHVHYFSMIDDGDMIAMVTPALQGFGSKYGARRCNGIPRIGFLSFDIKANGQIIMRKHFANMSEQVAKATKYT